MPNVIDMVAATEFEPVEGVTADALDVTEVNSLLRKGVIKALEYKKEAKRAAESKLDDSPFIQMKSFHGHRLSVTCMALGYDRVKKEEYIVTGSKDGSVCKWDLKTGRKTYKI